MSEPEWQPAGSAEYQRAGDEFTFRQGLGAGWTAHLAVSQLRDSHEGLHAEVTVTLEGQTDDGSRSEGHLSWSRLNLASTQSRAGLAKYLNTRANTADWPSLLETVCVVTAREYRRPQPIIDLRTVELPPGPRYLIDPLLPLGETTIWYGDGGALKSYLVLLAALAIRTGISLPCKITPLRQGGVLVLDYETTAEEQHERLRWLSRGINLPEMPQVHYRQCFRPLVDELALIRADVERLGVMLVVIDSLGPACGGDLNENEPVLRLMNGLRSLDPATRLAVAHISKANAEHIGPAAPFGSKFFWNMGRSLWEVRRTSEIESEIVDVGMYNRKVNRGRLRQPYALRFAFDDVRESLAVSRTDIQDSSELSEHAGLAYRLRALLRAGAMTVPEMAEELNAKERSVKSALYRMRDVLRLETGGGRGKTSQWGLKA